MRIVHICLGRFYAEGYNTRKAVAEIFCEICK